MNRKPLLFLLISIVLTFGACQRGEKITCRYFTGDYILTPKSREEICDSLSSLRNTEKFLFIHVSSETIEQGEKRAIGTLALAEEKIKNGAIVFVYSDSDKFDIIFSDSLKLRKFVTNRMRFVNALQLHRKPGINAAFFKAIISEFKKIDTE